MDSGQWWGIAGGVLAAVVGTLLAVWSARQDKARERIDKRLEGTDERVAALATRMTIIEEGLKHLPDSKELYAKLDAIKDLVSRLQNTEQLATAIADSLRVAVMERRKTPRS